MDRLEKVERFADRCQSGTCPELDCTEAELFYQKLAETEYYLDRAVRWLYRYDHKQLSKLEEDIGNTMEAAERLRATQWALGVQEYLHRFGSILLDLTSIAGSIDEVVSNPDELSKQSVLESLYDAYEAMKDLESAQTAAHAAYSGTESPAPVSDFTKQFFEEDADTVNDLVSHAGDVKDIIDAINDHGNDWRKVFKAKTEGGGELERPWARLQDEF